MKWTKRNVFTALNIEDDIRDHFLELFTDWWKDNVYVRPEDANNTHWIGEFFDNVGEGNFEHFTYDYDWKTKEWIIHYNKTEYRFPENWPYEDVDKEPDLEMLWHSGYYDGPLSGMALYNGKYVWFECDQWGECIDNDDPCPDYGMRTYTLHELSEGDLKDQFEAHERFRKYVGHHTDYGVNYSPYEGKPSNILDKFYNWMKRRPQKDFKKNKVLGTFAICQFRRPRPLPQTKKEGKVVKE